MPDPLRVALLTYSTRPRGGVVHTLALAEALADLGHRVDVWTLGRGEDTGFFRAVDPRVRLRVVPLPDRPDESVGERIVRSITRLGDALAQEPVNSYDVTHAQDCISANASAHCIRTIHHLDTFTTPELIACHERAIRRPYAHICVSRAVADEVRAGWGIEATVIANGVDADRFAAAAGPAGQSARARWTRRLGRYVLAVGGVEPRKGTLALVEAMAEVQTEAPDLRLVIGGGETLFDYRDYRARVLARADALGVEPLILGPVEHDALPALMAAAEVFAFPSVKEGFGLAPMEALAAGVAVVMSDLPVLREVFGGAVRFAGGTTDLAAEIRRAANTADPDRAAAGRALAGRHRWSDAARAHEKFYRRHAPG